MLHRHHAPGPVMIPVIVLAVACGGALEAARPGTAAAAVPWGTFSIVARDSVTGELGVAVQSRAFGVGAAVAWARAGVGAIATQSQTNESFGPRGLRFLAAGLDATETLDVLLRHDPGAANRQVGIIDAAGGVAAHTGAECNVWAGHRIATDVSCQGNILAGEAVVDTMIAAFQATDAELSRRLLAALVAGQAAGGDRRGVQSAALLVVRPSDMYPEYESRYVDLRVEDHVDPIPELIRVFEIHETTDLLRAHLRYAEQAGARGDSALAALEQRRVGETLRRVLARDDADASTLNALAWFTALAEVYLDDALEAARRAVALEPDNAEILDTLAEVHFRRGETAAAIDAARRALELEPDGPYYREQLERFEAARDAAGRK
ncbi:MAG: DUF1028 domain-containing protein [Candidatus Eiseniibacteriota bacterium]